MSKKISITVEIEVQDDDYENHYREDVESCNKENFKDLLYDIVDWEVPFEVTAIAFRSVGMN